MINGKSLINLVYSLGLNRISVFTWFLNYNSDIDKYLIQNI